MEEIRIRAATAADVPAIVDVVDRAYRHYIARIGKPPGPMLDDYAAGVSERGLRLTLATVLTVVGGKLAF